MYFALSFSHSDHDVIYYGIFTLSRDLNWDGRHPQGTGDHDVDRRQLREIRKHGITRHIILIRHGQYDESHKEDELRKLTATGQLQAELTGKRLAEIMNAATASGAGGGGGEGEHPAAAVGPSKIKALRVSAM
jgi:Histidine phosphatase superfamily (branch 1)